MGKRTYSNKKYSRSVEKFARLHEGVANRLVGLDQRIQPDVVVDDDEAVVFPMLDDEDQDFQPPPDITSTTSLFQQLLKLEDSELEEDELEEDQLEEEAQEQPGGPVGKPPSSLVVDRRWEFTRKLCHMSYNLATRVATKTGEGETADCKKLILPQIETALHAAHPGHTGLIEIWKEVVKIFLGNGKGLHHARAYHQPDEYGPFFDWVTVQD